MNREVGNPEPYPEEDSSDLTDSEIERAMETTGVIGVTEIIRAFCEACPDCGKPMGVESHALRRRKPNLFWRTRLKCVEGHDEQVTCQVNWMQESNE